MASDDFYKKANKAVLTGDADGLKSALGYVPAEAHNTYEEMDFVSQFSYFIALSAELGSTANVDLLLAHPNQSVVKKAASALLAEQAVTYSPFSPEVLEKLVKAISPDKAVVNDTLSAAFDAVAKRQAEGGVVNQAVFTALADNGAPVATAYLALQTKLYAEIAQLQGTLQTVGDVYSAATRTPAPPKR